MTKTSGIESYDTKSNSINLDSSINIYATASTNVNLYSRSYNVSSDEFLTKYNSQGSKSWTKLFGTYTPVYGKSVFLVSSDNLYIGIYSGYSYSYGSLKKINSINFSVTWFALGNNMRTLEDATFDSSDNIYVTISVSRFNKYNVSGSNVWTKKPF